jgi:hypothetical protein
MYKWADTARIPVGLGVALSCVAHCGHIRIFKQRVHGIAVPNEQRWHDVRHAWTCLGGFLAWFGRQHADLFQHAH